MAESTELSQCAPALGRGGPSPSAPLGAAVFLYGGLLSRGPIANWPQAAVRNSPRRMPSHQFWLLAFGVPRPPVCLNTPLATTAVDPLTDKVTAFRQYFSYATSATCAELAAP
jgi:hypothetical protein